MNNKNKNIIIAMYSRDGIFVEEIEDCFKNDYFKRNKKKFTKNQGLSTYDIERWIQLEEVLGCELNVNQAYLIMSELWEKYNLDTYDLQGLLKQ